MRKTGDFAENEKTRARRDDKKKERSKTCMNWDVILPPQQKKTTKINAVIFELLGVEMLHLPPSHTYLGGGINLEIKSFSNKKQGQTSLYKKKQGGQERERDWEGGLGTPFSCTCTNFQKIHQNNLSKFRRLVAV